MQERVKPSCKRYFYTFSWWNQLQTSWRYGKRKNRTLLQTRFRILHLESVVEMPPDFRGKDIISRSMGKVKDSWLMPTAFKCLFITLITSGSVSLMHCYLYNHFLEPQSVLPSRLVFLAHKKYLCFLKYFTLLIHISMRLP